MAVITRSAGRASLLTGVLHLILLAVWRFLVMRPAHAAADGFRTVQAPSKRRARLPRRTRTGSGLVPAAQRGDSLPAFRIARPAMNGYRVPMCSLSTAPSLVPCPRSTAVCGAHPAHPQDPPA